MYQPPFYSPNGRGQADQKPEMLDSWTKSEKKKKTTVQDPSYDDTEMYLGQILNKKNRSTV